MKDYGREFVNYLKAIFSGSAVGFSISGGTTSKTLTVEDTSLVNQDLTTDASPTFATETLSTAIADNTATTQAATTTFAKSQDAVLHRDPDQGVAMTAAASGSTGITITDNDNIDFGTGNFGLVWKGSLPDWAVSSHRFFSKWDSPVGIIWDLSSGQLEANINNVNHAASIANIALVAGTCHELAMVVIRGTSVIYYIDGVAFGASVTHSGTATTSNAVSAYIDGYDSVRNAGTVIHAYTLNFAPTAAEVLDMYRNGIPESWKWGSQTSIITGNDSTFAGASNWANVDLSAYNETTDLTITANGAGQYCTLPVANAGTTATKKYRLELDVANIVSTWTIKSFDGTQTIGTISANGANQKFEFIASTTGGLRLVSVAADSSGDFDNILLYQLGSTLALEPESWQQDKPYNLSSNNLTVSYPTVGWSLTRQPVRRIKQPAPTAKTTAVTLTIAELLTGLITGTHAAGATQAYTLPTGTLSDAWPAFGIDDYFDWILINLSAAAADTITLTADTGHTIVGNPIVQSANSSTGGLYGNSAKFRTRKTATNTFITYRIG